MSPRTSCAGNVADLVRVVTRSGRVVHLAHKYESGVIIPICMKHKVDYAYQTDWAPVSCAKCQRSDIFKAWELMNKFGET